MAKKHKHEDHVNHEAWAIPYGDLITLLLAFFVVMYAVSSVNEGKYRVLADSLSQAFGGPPKSMKPVQIGNRPEKGVSSDTMFNDVNLRGFEMEQPPRHIRSLRAVHMREAAEQAAKAEQAGSEGERRAAESLRRMSDAVEMAMKDLIRQKTITVRRTPQWLEIEISTDILYDSGVAKLAPAAVPVLTQLAGILKPFPNPLTIEGHTDNVPIATFTYPSNWELSAARAASVVHLFMSAGIEPQRMTVVGLGEYRPIASNADAAGRNRNRRVVLVVMAHAEDPAQPVDDAAADPDPTATTDLTQRDDGTVVVPPGTLSLINGVAP